LVRLLRFLEFRFGLRIAGVAVRVIFHGEAPVSLLELGLAGIPRDTEHLVVVALRHAVDHSPHPGSAALPAAVTEAASAPRRPAVDRHPTASRPAGGPESRAAVPRSRGAPLPSTRFRRTRPAAAAVSLETLRVRVGSGALLVVVLDFFEFR